MKLLYNSLPLRNSGATQCMYGCASSSRLLQPPPSPPPPPLALPLFPPLLTIPSNWRNKSQNSCRFLQTHQNLAHSTKSLPEISSPQDLTENKHTHTHPKREREKNNNNSKILTRNLKPTRTYRNKQTHTQREKQQQKSFLRSRKPNQPKFLPKISSPQDLTEINTHTHTKRKTTTKGFPLLPQNQINQISYAKSQAQKILQGKTHTHTQKRQIHTIQRKKTKTKVFPFLPHNQTKSNPKQDLHPQKRRSIQSNYFTNYATNPAATPTLPKRKAEAGTAATEKKQTLAWKHLQPRRNGEG